MKRDSRNLSWYISFSIFVLLGWSGGFWSCEDARSTSVDTIIMTTDAQTSRIDEFDDFADHLFDQMIDFDHDALLDMEVNIPHDMMVEEFDHQLDETIQQGNLLVETRYYDIRTQIQYSDRLYDASGFRGEYILRPAPYLLTQLMTQVGDIEEVLAESYTNAQGQVNFTWTHQIVHSHPHPPLWIRVIATQRTPAGSQAKVTSRRRGARYTLDGLPFKKNDFKLVSSTHQSPLQTRSEYRVNLSLTTLQEGSLSGAFNILAMTARGFELINQYSDQVGPQLTIRWDLDLPVSCGSCYSSEDLTIFLGGQVEDPDHYDDHIILHEMGHFFADQWSIDSSPGGSHRGRSVSPPLAYGEGFAYFWSALALRDPLIVDWMFPDPWVVDLEQEIYNGEPISLGVTDHYPATPILSEVSATHHEELVSTLMWDLYDSANTAEPDEMLQISEATMMHSFLVTLPERYQNGADIGARGVDLADWLDAISCEIAYVGLQPDQNQELSSPLAFPLAFIANLESEAHRRGYQWRSPWENEETFPEPNGDMGSEMSHDMGSMQEDQSWSSGGRCALKSSVPRAMITQDHAHSLWISLDPNDPFANELKQTKQTKQTPQTNQKDTNQEEIWQIRRWVGRPPHSREISAVRCINLPCQVSKNTSELMIFKLTKLQGLSSPVEQKQFQRVTTWIPDQKYKKYTTASSNLSIIKPSSPSSSIKAWLWIESALQTSVNSTP